MSDTLPYAVHNPNNVDPQTLPVIYGFNNGGSPGMFFAVLIAEDGQCMGSHGCSHECFMRHDLGILEGTRKDRHEHFQAKYPNGYRMDFVSYVDVTSHPGLQAALQQNALEREYGAVR